MTGVDDFLAEPFLDRPKNDVLQAPAVDRELRYVMAGIDAANVAPDFLTMAVEIIKHVGADRDVIELLQETEPGEFADRMRQRVDADAEFADGVGLFEQFAADAARPQHQGRGQAADTATDDNRLHRLLHSTHSLTSPRACAAKGADPACHPAYSAASGFVASALSSARVFGLALILSSSKSCRSRTLLRKIWSLPGRYCGGQNASVAPYQAAAFSVNAGSTRCGRPSATRSARPAARMVFI